MKPTLYSAKLIVDQMKNREDQGVMKKEIEMAVNDILDPFDGEK